jgi:nucleoside-diphosphate-sugar epimerase
VCAGGGLHAERSALVRYFVTGATGFVGGEVARQLLAAGHHVVAVARTPAKAQDLAALGVEVRQGDVTEKESMREAMRGADGVFHLAGWYKLGVKAKSEGERINVQGTRNVLELMRELAIPRGVYTSTLAVFSDTHGRMVDESYRYNGPHLSEYDRTKWVAHYQVADPMIAQGLPLMIVQPGLIYGPGDTSSVRATLISYLKRRLPMVPLGTAFCWGHVEDTARGHLQAMERGRPGDAYIIAGERYDLVGALRLAERITGVPGPRIKIAPGMMKATARLMSVVERVVPVPDDYTAEYLRENAGTTYLGDSSKAKRELGFQTRPLEVGFAETLRHEMRLLGMPVPQTTA